MHPEPPKSFQVTISYSEDNELLSFEELKLHLDENGVFQFDRTVLSIFLLKNAKLSGVELFAVMFDLSNVFRVILLWYSVWNKETGKVDEAAEALLDRMINPDAF